MSKRSAGMSCRMYAEHAAAIGTTMGLSPRWRDAYDAAQGPIGGFVGMWIVAADAALALEELVLKKGIEWGDGYEWPSTIHTLAEELLTFLIKNKRGPEEAELKRLVAESLSEE